MSRSNLDFVLFGHRDTRCGVELEMNAMAGLSYLDAECLGYMKNCEGASAMRGGVAIGDEITHKVETL